MATAATLAIREPIKPKARIWDRSLFKLNSPQIQGFQTYDGHTYAVHPSGAFVRIDKDRRSVKERKAANRVEADIRAFERQRRDDEARAGFGGKG